MTGVLRTPLCHYLRHLPFGIWLSMAKYEGAPFVKRLQSENTFFSLRVRPLPLYRRCPLAQTITDGISSKDARSLVGKVMFSVVRTGFVHRTDASSPPPHAK